MLIKTKNNKAVKANRDDPANIGELPSDCDWQSVFVAQRLSPAIPPFNVMHKQRIRRD